jgi:hypothetical protein
MSGLDRRKLYINAIENYTGAEPLNTVKIAEIIDNVALLIGESNSPSVATVKRWCKQSPHNRLVLTTRCGKGVTCKH